MPVFWDHPNTLGLVVAEMNSYLNFVQSQKVWGSFRVRRVRKLGRELWSLGDGNFPATLIRSKTEEVGTGDSGL